MQLSLVGQIRTNKRIVVTVADQAIYSGANYLFNVVLFRILSIEDYGIFSYTYLIFLFFNFIFSSGVLEPITVNGVKKGNSDKSLYNYYTITGLVIQVLLFFLIMLALQTWLFDKIPGNRLLVTLAITVGMLSNFVFITFKRIEYNENNQLASLNASILYFLVLMSSLLVGLYFKTQLSVYLVTTKIAFVYSVMAVASLSGFFFFRHRFPNHLAMLPKTSFRHVLKIGKINFGIAGWMYINCIFFWLTKYFFSGYLGYTKGFENTGIMKAAENLFLPMEQFISALGIVVFPTAVNRGSNEQASDHIKKVFSYLFGGVLLYVLVVIIFFEPISEIFYNKSNWDRSMIYVLSAFGFLTITRTIVDFYTGLRIRLFRKHKYFVLISCVTFLIVFLPGKYLLNQYGLYGVSLIYFSIGVIQILISFFLGRNLNSHLYPKTISAVSDRP